MKSLIPQPSSLHLSAPLVLGAAQGQTAAPFEGKLYDGGPLVVDAYRLPIVLDLAGAEDLDRARPVTLDHDDDKRVGHVEQCINDGRSLAVAGALSAPGRHRDEVLEGYRAKFPWTLSIEALPYQAELQVVAPRQSVQVNGRTVWGPCYVARRWVFVGASVVTRGADDASSLRIAARAAQQTKDAQMNEFETWVAEKLGLDPKTISEQQTALLKAEFARQAELVRAGAAQGAKSRGNKGNKKGDKTGPAVRARARLAAIRTAAKEHGDVVKAKVAAYKGKIADKGKLAEIRARGAQAAALLRTKALEKNWHPARLKAELVSAAAAVEVELVRAERPTGPPVHSSDRDVKGPVIEAALCRAVGVKDWEKSFDKETLEASDRYQHIGLQEVLLLRARAAGYDGRMRIKAHNCREVLRYAFQAPPVRAAFSTVSLPGIFSNVANKQLLAGFNEVEQVWRQIATISNVSDFKTSTAYRMLDDMVYEEIGPTGQIEHGEVGEESYTKQAKLYAKMFALTMVDIVNDDLGAFDSIRDRLGRGSGLKINRVFWKVLLDDALFFTADRGNLITAALSEAGYAAAEAALDSLTDGAGNPIDVQASLVLVPGALLPAAKKLHVATELRDTTANVKYPTANIYVGKYEPLKSRYITTAYGGTATNWWLLPRPAGDMAVADICFLDGAQEPTVESAEADFSTLGIQFRGYHAFGCQRKEWRAGVKSTGAG